MVARPSLKGRVALAISLLAGFYLLALGLAGALAYIPYAEWVYAHHVNGRIFVFCGAGAFAILRGIIPRRDRFDPPGPTITEAEQPRLFAAIKDVAAATNQEMPADVYLIPDVNAFVSQRGGVMGFGSRRVMGIGLPLLQSLNVSQFRAVIAHEFGHYHGGDTRLGPWIYQTRAAIMRTLESIGRHSHGLLQKPFIWYGAAFSRVTLAVSRRQEYVADELAARTCGAANLAGALKELERSGAAFGAFMRHDFVGVVEAGFRPPLVEGFARFQTAPVVRSNLDDLLAKALETGEAGPYDSHPSLSQRLSAISELARINPTTAFLDDDSRATTLIRDTASVEATVVASMLTKGAPPLAPIAWEDVPSRVLTISWAGVVGPSVPGLDGLTPAIFPEIASRLRTDADVLVRQLGVPRSADQPEFSRRSAEGILGAALALVLEEHRSRAPSAFQLSAAPGDPVTFRVATDDAELSIEPFAVLVSIRDGKIDDATWLDRCKHAGITDDDLGACARRAVDKSRKHS